MIDQNRDKHLFIPIYAIRNAPVKGYGLGAAEANVFSWYFLWLFVDNYAFF